MDIQHTEEELKKRWKYPYQWGRVQSNNWDKSSRFIYSAATLQEVLDEAQKQGGGNQEYLNYCLNRRYNFKSAQAVEYLFSQHPSVKRVEDRMDREKDFYIGSIPFDHKTTILPKGYGHTLSFVHKRKAELCRWFYQNQSKESRYHLKNRLFIVLHHQGGEHWKLKAELSWLQILVLNYLETYAVEKLITLDLNGVSVKTDIIFGLR